MNAVVQGTITGGSKRASALGFPTINLAYAERVNLPGAGVYAGLLRYEGAEYEGAISFGPAADGSLKLEIHCFKQVPISLGAPASFVFLKKVSEFLPGDDREMKRKIDRDVRLVRDFFSQDREAHD